MEKQGDNLKNRGIKAFYWDFSGTLLTYISSLVFTIVLARLLQPSDFGIIAIVMISISIITILSDAGFGAALMQRRKLHHAHYSSVFLFNITIGILLTISTYYLSSIISAFFYDDRIEQIIKSLSILFLFNSLTNVHFVILRKNLKNKEITKINLISTIISGCTAIFFSYLSYGIWSLVIQVITLSVVTNLLAWRVSEWKPSLAFSFKALNQLWSYGSKIFFSSILTTFFSQVDLLIVGKIYDSSMVGYFHRAKNLTNMVTQAYAGSLMSVLFPVLAQIQNNLSRFQNIVLRSLRVISFATFLIMGSLLIISEEVIILLFTEKWEKSSLFFQVFILSGLSAPMTMLLISTLSSRGNSKSYLKIEIFKSMAITLNIIVFLIYGMNSFLYGIVVTSVLTLLVSIFYSSKEINIEIKILFKEILIYFLIFLFSLVLTAILTSFFINDDISILQTIIKFSLYSALYIALNILFRTRAVSHIYDQFVNRGVYS